jgi:hypothetical protein
MEEGQQSTALLVVSSEIRPPYFFLCFIILSFLLLNGNTYIHASVLLSICKFLVSIISLVTWHHNSVHFLCFLISHMASLWFSYISVSINCYYLSLPWIYFQRKYLIGTAPWVYRVADERKLFSSELGNFITKWAEFLLCGHKWHSNILLERLP